ncbi:ankyrin [Sarocladium strictum]
MSIHTDYIRRFPHALDWADYTNSHDFLPPLLGGPALLDKQKQPLHHAIFQGDIPRLRTLLSSVELPSDATLNPRSRCPDVYSDDHPPDQDSIKPRPTAHGTALQYAASFGDLSAVDALLDAGVHPRWAVEDHGLAPRPFGRPLTVDPIALAVIYGHRTVVARLWKRSSNSDPLPAEPNQAEEEEEDHHPLPLRRLILECIHLAAHSGQVNIVQDLLSWVPSPELKGNALGVALSEGVKKWDPHVSAALLRHDDYVNQSVLIGLLIKAGANPNVREFGQPLLHRTASVADCTGALKALLENCASPNERDSDHGLTALHTAVGTVKYCRGDPAVETVRYTWNETAVRLLLDHGSSATQGNFQARGADTTAISDSGWTALHVLSLWGLGGHEQSILFPLALRLLQETPSLVDAPEPLPMPKDWNETDIGPNGESFFHWTEPRRNIDLLQWAIEKGSRDVVNALREVGVDTAAKNADGKTAFEIAREHADIHRWGRPVLSEQ